mmetsp:Transcript_50899/g.126761  ORF Transcript_50899/g.126761 Transcript_50899/m.126761 type:complete len:212 (+) Transcript_50899:109-744(+)
MGEYSPRGQTLSSYPSWSWSDANGILATPRGEGSSSSLVCCVLKTTATMVSTLPSCGSTIWILSFHSGSALPYTTLVSVACSPHISTTMTSGAPSLASPLRPVAPTTSTWTRSGSVPSTSASLLPFLTFLGSAASCSPSMYCALHCASVCSGLNLATWRRVPLVSGLGVLPTTGSLSAVQIELHLWFCRNAWIPFIPIFPFPYPFPSHEWI